MIQPTLTPFAPPRAPRRATHVLANGVTVVAVPTPGLRSAMIAAYVRVGSRCESGAKNGVSHFLEHVLFRGTARYPDSLALNLAAEDVGGSLNGATGRDSTCYYTPLHPAHLDVGVRVLADLLAAPRFEGVELEREIILEEMLDEVDETGRDIDLDNLAKMQLFPGHGLGLKIAGTPETVRALARADLVAHHARHYRGGSVVVCAAGDLHPDALFAACEREFGALPAGGAGWTPDAPVPPPGPTAVFQRHAESQVQLRLTFPGPAEQHPDYYPLLMIGRLLDDGLSSRLQRNIVENRALAYSVGAGVDRYADISLFELEAACTPAKAPAVVEEMCRTLGELRDAPPPEEELERSRQRQRMGMEFALDSASELCGWYGSGALFGDPDGFELRRQRLEAVTGEDVVRVARALVRPGALHLTCVGPVRARERGRLERIAARPAGLG